MLSTIDAVAHAAATASRGQATAAPLTSKLITLHAGVALTKGARLRGKIMDFWGLVGPGWPGTPQKGAQSSGAAQTPKSMIIPLNLGTPPVSATTICTQMTTSYRYSVIPDSMLPHAEASTTGSQAAGSQSAGTVEQVGQVDEHRLVRGIGLLAQAAALAAAATVPVLALAKPRAWREAVELRIPQP